MQQKKKVKKIMAFGLSLCMTLSLFGGISTHADSWPDQGESKIGSVQPHFSGYRVRDIETWDAETDHHAELMRARVPLQTRNARFTETQANSNLTAPVEVMLMQGDYGNSFFDSTIANNAYGNVAFNFWQYTDYFCPWHGAATIGTPRGLYNPATSNWQSRGFEFGIVNIPNQAYINAAHKNGVKAIACIYFDPSFRPGQTKQELFEKDAKGRYIIADRLIEMAKHYGFDGYFLNSEEGGPDEYKPFMAQITQSGLWTQFYNTDSSFGPYKSQYLKDEKHGKIHDSVFVNYGWSNVDSFVLHAESIGVDPYETVFLGIEANHGQFKNHGETAIQKSYDRNKNPKASVALFTPSDMYQRGIDSIGAKLGFSKQLPAHQRNEFQWMVAERERMYFSGVMCNPKDTGKKPGYQREDVVVSDASGWVGVADFRAESSVISGSSFYTNFNIGKGMQYFADGKMLNDEPWTNLNDQDILPSWQWWFETTAKKALKADFDFGSKDIQKDREGQVKALPYQQVGAWHGGNSLVVYGDLEAGKENFLRLYKTDLTVRESTKAKIRFRKSSEDNAEMKLGLLFKDQPYSVQKVNIENASTKGEWTEASLDLSPWSDKQIAALGFVFESEEAVSGYQMNIGQIAISDTVDAPEKPDNFQIQKLYQDGQVIFTWDRKDYQEVDKYRIYSKNSDGTRHFLGGIYDGIWYVKNHFADQEQNTIFELTAVGKDGIESSPAQIEVDWNRFPKNLAVEEDMLKELGFKQAKELGKLEISWNNAPNQEAVKVKVAPLWKKADDEEYHLYEKELVQGEESITLEVPEMKDGYEYDVTVSPKFDGQYEQGISYRGRFFDGYAKPLSAKDVKLLDGDKIMLKSPLTKDWHYVTVEFKADGAEERTRLMRKERGVDRRYHAALQLPASKGTIYIELEDYTKNKSEITIVYDEEYKFDLKTLVRANKYLVEEREKAEKKFKNANLKEILDRLEVLFHEAKEILQSLEDNRQRVPELTAEMDGLINSLEENDNSVTITFEWAPPTGITMDDLNGLVSFELVDSEQKVVPANNGMVYELFKGTYYVKVKSSHFMVLTSTQRVVADAAKTVPVLVELVPTSGKLLSAPKKLTYQLGEELDLTGGLVELTYRMTPKVQKELTDANFTISGYDKNTLGEQTVKVSGLRQEFSFVVTVIEKQTNKEDLMKAITDAEAVKENFKYFNASAEKREAFDKSMEDAVALHDEEDVSVERLEAAIENLKQATDALDGEETKKEALNEAIESAKQIKETAKYKNAELAQKEYFELMLTLAEEAKESNKASQEEVDLIIEMLREAQNSLNGQETPAPNPDNPKPDNPKPEPEPKPEPQPEVLLPYIPEVTEEVAESTTESAPEVKIEEEEIALSAPEDKAKFEELTKNVTDEKTRELVKELVTKKLSTEAFARKIGDEALQNFAQNIEEKFSDTKAEVWFAKELAFAEITGLVKGFEDNTFRGEKEVTGKEFLTMLVRASGKEVKAEESKDWFAPYFAATEQLGLLTGVDFDLSRSLTRQEVAKLAYNYAMIGKSKVLLPNRKGMFTDREDITEDYLQAVDYLWEKGVLKGYEDESYRGLHTVKRQEIVAILYRLLKNK
ncbi:MAG: S-layer homology domain-containing protein [Eubacteriales bacterium]|nr:S-layer homology domain-containing protein [Eubacteriales bacterium]